jgi:hypothetical protein
MQGFATSKYADPYDACVVALVSSVKLENKRIHLSGTLL